ncbi:MAG: aminoacyl-tRNA hydrolase [Acidobacteriota bacterium]
MKLVAGLGNPGPKYRGTRHNVGFDVVDCLAGRWRVDGWREQQQALTARHVAAGEPVLLAKPLTFMNLSGEAVGGLAGFYKIDPADVLVLVDDADLPLGRLRARREGGAGGHNGLKSVIAHLGTQAFARLRIGVGRGDGRRDLADHVLARFDADERETIEAAVRRAADAAEMWITDGIERVMNAFNAADNQQETGPAT